MPPLRFLHVFPRFEVGGSQMRTARLMAGWSDQGREFEHALVALDGCTEAAARVPPEVGLELLDAPPRAGTPATVLRLRGLLRRTRPDLLLTYNWGAIDAILAAALPGGPPVVHHEDGFGSDEAAGPLPRRSRARRLLFRAVRHVVVPSQTLADIGAQRWGLGAPRLALIPNGIDLARFRPSAPDERAHLRAELGLPPDGPLIGSLGSLRPEKHLVRLIEAFESLPAELGARLAIVGDGACRAELEARAAASPRRATIHFTGGLDDPARAQRAFDLFCLSSDTEQMPLALVEAMACALPAVSTDVGDVARILPPGPGGGVPAELLADPLRSDAAEALGRVLANLIRDPERAHTLGEANCQRARTHYGLETMLERYAALYAGAAERA